MTCHCRSNEEHEARQRAAYADQEQRRREGLEREVEALRKTVAASSPDNTKFQIVAAEEVGKNLVLKVLYPNCALCSFEGLKVMVFLGVGLKQAILWRKIDPHFREPNKTNNPNEAPPPAARFPASEQGWKDALWYAGSR